MWIWKNSIRQVQVLILIGFTVFLTRTADYGSRVVYSISGTIDNYYNVENYHYSSDQHHDNETVLLKDCDYSFCEHIEIPGMPDTRENDFLNQYIFSESQCPQGICFTEEYVLITSYSEEEDCKGELMVIDRETGEYLVTLGMDEKSHLGGVAFDGTNVWVCNSNTNTVERISYDFIQLMAAENQKEVVDVTALVDVYPVSNKPSCITYYNGRLWIATHKIFFQSKMIAYHLDTQADRLEVLSEYQIPPRVQGIAFNEAGEVYLSTSYGRRESSYLKKYDSLISLSTHPKRPDIQVEMLPCSEEIDILDDQIYVIFESAGEKYLEGTDGNGSSICPIDQILCIQEESITVK